MRFPSALELMALWEEGRHMPPLRQGLLLLAQLFPEQEPAALAQLPIGVRDGHLLTLREQLFGRQLACTLSCPSCGERIELDCATGDIQAPVLVPPGETMIVEVASAGYQVRCRLPNSADLLAIAGLVEPVEARQALLRRCLLAITSGENSGAPVEIEALPEGVAEATIEQMAQADRQGDVQLALNCPVCSHHWLVSFDILSFLWDEIGDWARRTLREVHTLASAYGWTEAEILALSAGRRQFYLQLVAGL